VYFEAAKNFGLWLKDYAQFADGSLPLWVHADDSKEDAATLPTAQAIRLWVRLYLATRDAGFRDAATRAGNFLLGVQFAADSGTLNGGFSESPSSPASTASTVATATAALAFDDLSQVLANPDVRLEPGAPRYEGFDPSF
jgi:hypothetical protein